MDALREREVSRLAPVMELNEMSEATELRKALLSRWAECGCSSALACMGL